LENEIQRRLNASGRRISAQLQKKIRKTLVDGADGM
jgi:hypothetical protein